MSPAWRSALWALCALIFAFLLVPIGVIALLSFTSSDFLVYPLPGFSLRWYRAFFGDPAWAEASLNTAIVALATTALATVLGTLAALGLNRPGLPGRGLILAILIAPLFVPVIVAAVGIFYLYAAMGLSSTYAGLILAHTCLALPFVVMTVLATLAAYDPAVTRAGLSLGATPMRVFFSVTLPIIWPGVLSGALFAFATSLDEVVVTLFLSGPEIRTLPRALLNGAQENLSPTVTAAATVLIAVSLLVMVVVEQLRRRGERLRGLA